jgi:hypothetical protein
LVGWFTKSKRKTREPTLALLTTENLKNSKPTVDKCPTHRADRYTVDDQKLHEFLFYNAFREKRQKRRRGGEPVAEAGAAEAGEEDNATATQEIKGFDPVDFDAVMAKYNPALFPEGEQRPEPIHGIGESAIVQYKCAVKKLWQEQVNLHINNLAWDFIFNAICKKTIEVVANRKERQNRANFSEKVDSDYSALANNNAIKKLEHFLFEDDGDGSSRSVFCSARNCFVFLHTAGGILHGESVYKAELSDLFHTEGKNNKDVHDWMVLIQQILSGKTNKNTKLLGRVMRHKDVTEWDTVPDFSENASWYTVKLLVHPYSNDYTTSISDRTDTTVIRDACKKLKLTSNHWLHAHWPCSWCSGVGKPRRPLSRNQTTG